MTFLLLSFLNTTLFGADYFPDYDGYSGDELLSQPSQEGGEPKMYSLKDVYHLGEDKWHKKISYAPLHRMPDFFTFFIEENANVTSIDGIEHFETSNIVDIDFERGNRLQALTAKIDYLLAQCPKLRLISISEEGFDSNERAKVVEVLHKKGLRICPDDGSVGSFSIEDLKELSTELNV